MSHVLSLIERQVSVSNVRERLAALRPGQYVAEDGTVFGPCLLISRELGSGGELAAQQASEILGWNVFDSQIVDEIARSAHVHQRLVRSCDERLHTRLERALQEFLPDDLGDETYLRHLKEVVMALCHHGNVIVVGRGAQYFIPPQCAVRARFVAPPDVRVKRLAEFAKLTLEEARAKVEESDRLRTEFVRKIFKKDFGSPLNQDITINTDEISIEGAVKIILATLKEKLGVSCHQTVRATGGKR